MKITPDFPKNESVLIQMIWMGKSIHHKWGNERVLPVSAKLGANAILGVSLAVCKAGAAEKV